MNFKNYFYIKKTDFIIIFLINILYFFLKRNFKTSSVNFRLTNNERDNFKLTQNQKDILIGLILGDLYIRNAYNKKIQV
jgi:hypothetical protein